MKEVFEVKAAGLTFCRNRRADDDNGRELYAPQIIFLLGRMIDVRVQW